MNTERKIETETERHQGGKRGSCFRSLSFSLSPPETRKRIPRGIKGKLDTHETGRRGKGKEISQREEDRESETRNGKNIQWEMKGRKKRKKEEAGLE